MADPTDSSCDPQNIHETSSGSDSPTIYASVTTSKRRKERDTRKRTQQGREDSDSRSRSPSHASTSTSTSSCTSKLGPGRKKSSFIWNHCHSNVIDGVTHTICDHCVDQSWVLHSSTSTAKYHIIRHHWEKLSAEEKIELSTKSQGDQKTTPTSKLPIRSSAAHLTRQIGHQSQKGREWDVLLSQAIISGSLP